MMRKISVIKADSREFLLDKYSSFVPLLLLYFLMELAASLLPDLFFSYDDIFNEVGRMGTSFILSVLFGLAGVGLIKAALDSVRGMPVAPGTLFYAFKNRSNRFVIVQLIFTAIQTVLILPLIPLNKYAVASGMTALRYYIFYVAIQLAAIFITMLLTLRLVWAFYFMLDDLSLDAIPALKKSLAFTKGRTLEILLMKLSFIGMFFLAYCSLMIGFLYVRPYAEVTYAKYYLENK